MKEAELKEFEDYFTKMETETGTHNPGISLLAGIGVCLVELIRRTPELGDKPKKDDKKK